MIATPKFRKGLGINHQKNQQHNLVQQEGG